MAQVRLTWPNEAYTTRILKVIKAAGNYQRGIPAAQLEVTVNRRRGREPPVPTPTDFGFASMVELLKRMETDGKVETKMVGPDFFVRASKAIRDLWTREDASPVATGRSPTAPTGLKNMGNTCYMNAVLQVFEISNYHFCCMTIYHDRIKCQ